MATPRNESVVKAFEILAVFAEARDGLTLSEAAARTGMKVPTVHRFIRTLLAIGALERRDGGRYLIGQRVHRLAIPGIQQRPEAVIQRHAEALALEVRETSHSAILADDMVRYVAKAEAPRSLRIATMVGTTLEAYCTGVGKALLAFQPPGAVDRYLSAGGFLPLTPGTLTTAAALRHEFARIREIGYAVDDEEFEQGLRCIAAPVFVNGRVVAAISCAGPASRLVPERIADIAARTRRSAVAIGRELSALGQSGWSLPAAAG